jgi:hypothetical protein
MKTKTSVLPIPVDEPIRRMIREAAAKTELSQASVMRRALLIGVPEVVRQFIPGGSRSSGQSSIKIRTRKGSHAVATAGRPITTAEIKTLLADFP